MVEFVVIVCAYIAGILTAWSFNGLSGCDFDNDIYESEEDENVNN